MPTTVCVVRDSEDDASKDKIRELVRLMEKSRIAVTGDTTMKGFRLKKAPVEESDADLVVVFGGDRTILRTFQRLRYKATPVLGVNTAGFSFLTEIDARQFGKYVDRLWSGDYTVEDRQRVIAKVKGKKIPPALNEVAVFPVRSGTLMRYSLRVDSELVWRDGADGLVIASPTGSTGHSMSAGGPMVAPHTDAIIITPVTSTSASTHPLIVDSESRVNIETISAVGGCELVIDGQTRVRLEADHVTVQRAKNNARFVRFEKGKISRVTGRLKRRVDVFDQDIERLPPSAKFIYKLLQYEKELTQKEIIKESGLPDRTVRHSLNILVKEGMISRRTSLRDTRQDFYRVK